MRRNKEFMEVKDTSNNICKGVFYIRSKRINEYCPNKELCEKYILYQKENKNLTLDNLHKVCFNNINAFRKCKFRKEKEE